MFTKKNQDAPPAPTLGAGGVYVGAANTGAINTGVQINGNVQVGGDFIGRDKITYGATPRDLEALFAPLLAAIVQHTRTDIQAAAAAQQAVELQAEIAKGGQAEDGKLAKIIEKLTDLAPGAVGALISLFAAPLLEGIKGPVTKYVLDKLTSN
ncbi:MAG: hypothetical protein WC130_12105 [Kiritimatiellia bacterium]